MRFSKKAKRILTGMGILVAINFLCISNLLAVSGSPSGSGGVSGTGGISGTSGSSLSGSGTPASQQSAFYSSAIALLQKIAEYTQGTLTAVTSTSNPVVTAIVSALMNLTASDNSTNPPSPTPTLQATFTNYVSQSNASIAAQTALQTQLLGSMFSNFTQSNVNYANDLAFQSVLGNATPFYNPDPRGTGINSALNYLQYASGAHLTHAIPSPSWKGSVGDQVTYNQYFNTVYAAQTFNAYVLGQLYEDGQNGIPATQTALINQASDPTNWFATVATESIGAVLRQILIYQSQSYIMLTQLLQTEKMLLASQAINNTLLIATSASSESMMVRKAVVPTPGL